MAVLLGELEWFELTYPDSGLVRLSQASCKVVEGSH